MCSLTWRRPFFPYLTQLRPVSHEHLTPEFSKLQRSFSLLKYCVLWNYFWFRILQSWLSIKSSSFTTITIPRSQLPVRLLMMSLGKYKLRDFVRTCRWLVTKSFLLSSSSQQQHSMPFSWQESERGTWSPFWSEAYVSISWLPATPTRHTDHSPQLKQSAISAAPSLARNHQTGLFHHISCKVC